MPAAQRARDVAIRELALERRRPALAVGLVPPIGDCAVELVDVGRRPSLACVLADGDRLYGERVFRDADLAGRDEIEGRLGTVGRREWVARDVRRERAESFERDVLVWGPRVGGVAMSDTPEEPAVEGRVSMPSMGDGGSLLGVGFLRVGTPSGQVHRTRRVVRHARDASSR